MSYEYSENILVQESAGDLLQNELGWRVVFAYNQEILGESGTFGRTSYREVLLQRYFREALQKLNSWITPSQIDEAVQKFTATLSTSSLLQINEEKYGFIRDGIPVSYKKPDGTSSISKAINSKIVKAMPFIIPDCDLLKKFHLFAKPIFDEVFTKQKQTQDMLFRKIIKKFLKNSGRKWIKSVIIWTRRNGFLRNFIGGTFKYQIDSKGRVRIPAKIKSLHSYLFLVLMFHF